MDYYHAEVVRLLLEGGCKRLDEVPGRGYRWHSEKNGVVFSVDHVIRSQEIANGILLKAGLAPVIKPPPRR